MANFEITKIAENVYDILDEGRSSFYVVEGDEKSAVIDTGITEGEKIVPMIRQLTSKPLLLASTHAHGDHLYHMDEFEEIYLCHDELNMPPELLRQMTRGQESYLGNTNDIRTGTIIQLGGDELEVCQVPGHTPGSVVFLEKKHNMLFTGDAIGSGYGVWMQVLSAVPLETYYESLVHLMKWLVERGGRMSFWGGHNRQQFESSLIPNYNPLSLGLLADLIDLVDKVLKKEIMGRSSEARPFQMEPTRYASFGRAELEYRMSNLYRKQDQL